MPSSPRVAGFWFLATLWYLGLAIVAGWIAACIVFLLWRLA